MFKSRSRGLFGSSPPGEVTIVDTPVRMTYARKARLTFWVVSLAVVALSGTVASHYLHPILGLFAGMAIGLVVGFVAAMLVTAWPVLRVIWHWADAILAAVVVFYSWNTLMQATELTLSLLIVTVLVGVPMAVGPIRRRVIAFVWCAVVRHRLRLSFAHMLRSGSRGAGRLQPGCAPFILIARPTPAGERVWVWLRPGLALPDLEAALPQLAVNCFADQVRVTRASGRFAALVRVDITRRDPLQGRVVSPLPGLTPRFDPSLVPVSPGMPAVGLDLPDVPEPADTTHSRGGRPPRKSRNGTTASPTDEPSSPDQLDDDPDGLNDPFI